MAKNEKIKEGKNINAYFSAWLSFNVIVFMLLCVCVIVCFMLCSIGGVTNVLITELFTQSTRPAAYMIANSVNWLSFFIISMVFPFIVVCSWTLAKFTWKEFTPELLTWMNTPPPYRMDWSSSVSSSFWWFVVFWPHLSSFLCQKLKTRRFWRSNLNWAERGPKNLKCLSCPPHCDSSSCLSLWPGHGYSLWWFTAAYRYLAVIITLCMVAVNTVLSSVTLLSVYQTCYCLNVFSALLMKCHIQNLEKTVSFFLLDHGCNDNKAILLIFVFVNHENLFPWLHLAS